MEKTAKTAAAAALARRLCADRLGDCLGMVAAGAVFLCLAPPEGPEAGFRYAGLAMATAGILLSGVGMMERMSRR